MKKIILQLAVLIGIAALGLSLSHIASAVYSIPTEYMPDNMPFNIPYDKGDPGVTPLQFILQIIAGSLLYIAAPLAVISIAIAAFNIVMNSTNPEKVEGSKKHLKWAITGLVVILVSYAIVKALITIVYSTFTPVTTEQTVPSSDTVTPATTDTTQDTTTPSPQQPQPDHPQTTGTVNSNENLPLPM